MSRHAACGVACAAALLSLLSLAARAQANAQLEAIMRQMEEMTVDLRDEVEAQYARRCALSDASCRRAAYDGCVTEYSAAASCESEFVKIPECGSCGAVFDFSTTNVRIPKAGMSNGPGSSPATASLKETVCFTNALSPFMVRQAEEVQQGGVFNEIPQTYFGAHNGLFRYFPARQTGVCGSYDPRVRPWFTAASSGPKDVILVLDTSGSMTQQGRWEIAKQAAKAVLHSLSIADHFSVVLFSMNAYPLSELFVSPNDGQSLMVLATEENVRKAVDALDDVRVDGPTNFQAAMDLTFDILDYSVPRERTSNCHRAVLFLTDGEMTYPEGLAPREVHDLVGRRNAQYNATLFTYSLGASAARDIPKDLACSTGGIWSAIPDGDDLASYMAAYYKLFAIGLGGAENRDFVAWVEPYLYESGEDYGTTVSAPVYDRSVDPPIWLGVVGVDFTVGAMTRVVGGSNAYEVVLEKLVATSVARCPALDDAKLPCLIESLRREAGNDASCGVECPVDVRSEPETCGSDEYYPSELWVNQAFKADGYHAVLPYTERTCCDPDAAASGAEGGGAGTCSSSDLGEEGGATVGVIAGAVVGVAVLVVALMCCRIRQNKARQDEARMAREVRMGMTQPGYPSTVRSNPSPAPMVVQMGAMPPGAPAMGVQYVGASAPPPPPPQGIPVATMAAPMASGSVSVQYGEQPRKAGEYAY